MQLVMRCSSRRGLSEPAFEQQYGTEEQCRAAVIASRCPKGFECPIYRATQYSLVTTRVLYQRTKCRRQTSPIAGTIFASTRLPLRLRFRAIYHLTQTKQGLSSIELSRRPGGLEDQAQVEAGHARAGCQQASDRPDRDRRRLSRR